MEQIITSSLERTLYLVGPLLVSQTYWLYWLVCCHYILTTSKSK